MALWARMRSFWHNAAPKTSLRAAASPPQKPRGSRGSSSDPWRNTRKRLGRVSG
jgi:hypothetical protein